MIDTSKTIEIGRSVWKTLGLAVMGAFMTVAMLLPFMLDGQRMGRGQEILLLCCAGFFALATIVIFKRLFTQTGPILTIGPEGLRDSRIAAETIPWQAITGLSTWTYKCQKVLVLGVLPEVEEALAISPLVKHLRPANRMFGLNGLRVGTTDLQISYANLWDLVVAYRRAAEVKAAGTHAEVI
ncbi:STM3941 family protein [Rhodomicrobium lacus]|uniref:STM3941 family protein n=1 Tax=Rhodomicrobium lacus TaxID=2498452 RepID=UPI0026E412D5|nr:STM3941 family protein [Rhodomicrobium lacus]WKW49851.1 STM3941 family protein [Rhodomicrobium lacus]